MALFSLLKPNLGFSKHNQVGQMNKIRQINQINYINWGGLLSEYYYFWTKR